MRKILIAALLLAAAPAALAAQHHPVPLPLDTMRAIPTVVPRLLPQSTSRAEDALAGAMEGALFGTVYAAIVTQTRPWCAPSSSVGESALTGAAAGAVWGGLRGLLGLRKTRGRIRTDLPEPDATAIPAAANPSARYSRCGTFPNGAFPDFGASPAAGSR